MSENSVPSSAFAPQTIESDLSWLPDLSDCEEPPASTEIYVQAYLADPDTWHWSTDMLNGQRETILKRALAIIARARLPVHEKALGQLGAGPLENLMSDTLLDDLHAWEPFSHAMRYALACVRLDFEPPALQRRLAEILAKGTRSQRNLK